MDWYSQKPIDLRRRELIRKFGEDGNGGRWIKHYCSSHKILLVGEGNFSFSACLAKAFGLACNMVATSLDSLEFLSKNYEDARSNIRLLLNSGCNVIHGVDATRAAHHGDITGMSFDRIVFNFPHAGCFDKSIPRSERIKRHQTLLLDFFANTKEMLSDDGEIHVVHKTNGFHKEWEIEKLASKSGLHLMEQSDFSLNDYPGYKNKYGYGGDKDFDWRPSKTYKFGLRGPNRGSFSLGDDHPPLWPDVPANDEADDSRDLETNLSSRSSTSGMVGCTVHARHKGLGPIGSPMTVPSKMCLDSHVGPSPLSPGYTVRRAISHVEDQDSLVTPFVFRARRSYRIRNAPYWLPSNP